MSTNTTTIHREEPPLTAAERRRFALGGCAPDLEEPGRGMPTLDEFNLVVAALKDERSRIRFVRNDKSEIRRIGRCLSRIYRLCDRLYGARPDGGGHFSTLGPAGIQSEFLDMKRYDATGWQRDRHHPLEAAHEITYAAMYHTGTGTAVRTAFLAEDVEKLMTAITASNSVEYNETSPNRGAMA